MNNNYFDENELQEQEADKSYYYRNRTKVFAALSMVFSCFSAILGFAPFAASALILWYEINAMIGFTVFMLNSGMFLIGVLVTFLIGIIPGAIGLIFALKGRFEINGMPVLSRIGLVVSICGIGFWLSFLLLIFLHWGSMNTMLPI